MGHPCVVCVFRCSWARSTGTAPFPSPRCVCVQVFLGQKYGYRPIPTHIVAVEFVLLRECAKNVPEEMALLDNWYKKDENTVPPVYILQPISSILTNFNNKVR